MSFHDAESKIRSLIEQGNAKFGTNVHLSSISWNLRGKSAGKATLNDKGYFIHLNREVLEKYPDHMMNVTIPHEVAHLIVFALIKQGRSKDRGHGRDFQYVCRFLGGTGDRCHTLKLTPARVRSRYVYVLPSGLNISISSVTHNRIQQGKTVRRAVATGEIIRAYHFAAKA